MHLHYFCLLITDESTFQNQEPTDAWDNKAYEEVIQTLHPPPPALEQENIYDTVSTPKTTGEFEMKSNPAYGEVTVKKAVIYESVPI